MLTIKRITEVEDAKRANAYLTRLIQDEKRYDNNINENCQVTYCYENMLSDDTNCILLASFDDEVVGYLYGYIIDGGDAYLEKSAQLEAMFVEEEKRGQQIGTKLIRAFKKWAYEQGVKYIELKVCVPNISALHLYQKEGFVTTKYVMQTSLEGFDETI